MRSVAVPDQVRVAAQLGHRTLREMLAAHGGTPVHEDGAVTLLHIGTADAVGLRHWLDIFPAIPPFEPISDGVWATSFPFPGEARIEYKIAVRRHGRQRLRLDALNAHHAANPWGLNSELRGSSYAPPAWARLTADIPRGTVTRHDFYSAVYSEERSLHIYRPPTGAAAALLVVHDGDDYLQYAGLAKVLDNLIAAGDVPPVAAVLTDPGDRFAEYRASAAHAAHLLEEVVPMGQAATDTDRIIAMGASLGGVAALHAAWSHPGVFSGLLIQAGSFIAELGGPFARGPVFAPVARFMRSFRARPGPVPERIHLSCGRFDGLINEARTMAEELAALGATVGYADNAAGHDWHGWRDLLRPALVHTLGEEAWQ